MPNTLGTTGGTWIRLSRIAKVAAVGALTGAVIGGLAGRAWDTAVAYMLLGAVLGLLAMGIVALARRPVRWSWLVLAIVAVWGATVLVLNSDGQPLIGFGLYFFGGLVFGFLTLVATFITVRGVLRRDMSLNRLAPLGLQWLVLGVVFLGVGFGYAFRLRFELSRPALESASEAVRRGETLTLPARIGTFRVREIDTVGTAVRFIVGESFLDDVGVVLSPDSKPLVVGEDTYLPLSGDWWLWERSW